MLPNFAKLARVIVISIVVGGIGFMIGGYRMAVSISQTPPFVPVTIVVPIETGEPFVTEEPLATEEPFVTEDSPITEDLDVVVDVKFENCSCKGEFKNAIVILTINNGLAPFDISGIGPVYPVLSKFVAFQVPVGSSFSLVITSSDGLTWKSKDISISLPPPCPTPISCTP